LKKIKMENGLDRYYNLIYPKGIIIKGFGMVSLVGENHGF